MEAGAGGAGAGKAGGGASKAGGGASKAGGGASKAGGSSGGAGGKAGGKTLLQHMASANPCCLTIFFNWLFDPSIGSHKGEDEGCVDLRGGIIKTDLSFECFLTPLQLDVVFKLRCLSTFWLKKSMLMFEHSPYSNRLILSLTESTCEGDLEADYFKKKRTLTLKMRTEKPPNVETELIPELADFILSLNSRIKKEENNTEIIWESPETFVYPVLPPRKVLMQQIQGSGLFTRPTKDDETGKLHNGNRVEFSHTTFLPDSTPPLPPPNRTLVSQSLISPLPLSNVARMLCDYQSELKSLRPADLGIAEVDQYRGSLERFYKESTCSTELPHLRRIISLFSLIAGNENRRQAQLITSTKASDLEHIQSHFDINLKNLLSQETLYMCRQSPKEAVCETLWFSLAFSQHEKGNKEGHKNGSGGCSVM